jgi:hypothetical protein
MTKSKHAEFFAEKCTVSPKNTIEPVAGAACVEYEGLFYILGGECLSTTEEQSTNPSTKVPMTTLYCFHPETLYFEALDVPSLRDCSLEDCVLYPWTRRHSLVVIYTSPLTEDQLKLPQAGSATDRRTYHVCVIELLTGLENDQLSRTFSALLSPFVTNRRVRDYFAFFEDYLLFFGAYHSYSEMAGLLAPFAECVLWNIDKEECEWHRCVGDSPAAVQAHATTRDFSRFYVTGGMDKDGHLINTCTVMDIQVGIGWKSLEVPPKMPQLVGHNFCVSSDRMIIVGGMEGTPHSKQLQIHHNSTVYVWDLNKRKKIETYKSMQSKKRTLTCPTPRVGHCLFACGTDIFCLGGSDAQGTLLSDLFVLYPTGAPAKPRYRAQTSRLTRQLTKVWSQSRIQHDSDNDNNHSSQSRVVEAQAQAQIETETHCPDSADTSEGQMTLEELGQSGASPQKVRSNKRPIEQEKGEEDRKEEEKEKEKENGMVGTQTAATLPEPGHQAPLRESQRMLAEESWIHRDEQERMHHELELMKDQLQEKTLALQKSRQQRLEDAARMEEHFRAYQQSTDRLWEEKLSYEQKQWSMASRKQWSHCLEMVEDMASDLVSLHPDASEAAALRERLRQLEMAVQKYVA